MQPGKGIPQRIAAFVKRIIVKEKQTVLSDQNIKQLEDKIEYVFNDKQIITQALKHRSYLAITNENRLHSNERLELLGDAVLGLVVTEHLFKRFPDKEEGGLTAIKSLIVSRKILARVANNSLFLGRFLLLNDAEEKSGGRKRPSIVADALESLIGAIYLDGGLRQAIDFINRYILNDLTTILSEERNRNFKSMLLEYSQSKSYGLPAYHVMREEGPDHNKVFTIQVKVNDQVLGKGSGNSKKYAEQMAAKNALRKLALI
jgi:ribonuclease III